MTVYILGSVVALLGGFVQGCMGFALAMIIVPPLMMVLPATTVVPLLVILSLVNTSTLVVSVREHVQPSIVGPLIAGSVFGIPIGMLLLTTLDGPWFKMGVGLFLVGLAGIMLAGWKRPLKNQTTALYPIGLLCGFMNGAIAMGGPPVVLFLANQETQKETFRATLLAFFTLLSSTTLVFFALRSMIPREVLLYSAVFVPIALVGTYFGAKASQRLAQSHFERITLVCAAAMGTVLFLRNLVDVV